MINSRQLRYKTILIVAGVCFFVPGLLSHGLANTLTSSTYVSADLEARH